MRYSSPPTDYIVKSSYRDEVFLYPYRSDKAATAAGFPIYEASDEIELMSKIPINFGEIDKIYLHYIGRHTVADTKIDWGIISTKYGEMYLSGLTEGANLNIGDVVQNYRVRFDFTALAPTISAHDILVMYIAANSVGFNTDLYITGLSVSYSVKNSY